MTTSEMGSYLRKFREQAKITQEDLADQLGVSRQSIIALESGKCIPSVALALRISRVFEMPVEYIFRYQEEQNEQESNKRGENMSRDLLPWSPLREMMSLRETIDRFFDEPTPRSGDFYHPAVGIRETEKELVIEADLPGVKEEEVDLSIEDDKLVIRGEKKHRDEVKKEDYYHLESSYGTFTRVVALPSYVEADKAQAEMKDGILEIRMPKVLEKKTRKIALKKKADSAKIEAKKSDK